MELKDEPLDVDLVVSSKPLSKKDAKRLSNYLDNRAKQKELRQSAKAYAEVYEKDVEMKEWANFSPANFEAMVLPLNVQYVTDKKGKKTAVVIPIQEWKELKTFLEYQEMKRQLTDAFQDMKAMQSGKKKKQTLKEFLNEL